MRFKEWTATRGLATLLACSGLLASTALAGAPGNVVQDDCEYHNGIGFNHCNTGTTNPAIKVTGEPFIGYKFNSAGQQVPVGGYRVQGNLGGTAYASLDCTDGDMYRGQITASEGVWSAGQACIGFGQPLRSVCGLPEKCAHK